MYVQHMFLTFVHVYIYTYILYMHVLYVNSVSPIIAFGGARRTRGVPWSAVMGITFIMQASRDLTRHHVAPRDHE